MDKEQAPKLNMFRFSILAIFLNLVVISLTAIVLLYILPIGSSVTLFRICGGLVLLGLNVGFFYHTRRKLKRENSVRCNRIFFIVIFSIGLIGLLASFGCFAFGDWDAWAVWNVKSHDVSYLYIQGKEIGTYQEDWTHKGYPPAYPMMLAFIAIMLGGWSHYIPTIFQILLYCWLALMMYDVMRFRNPIVSQKVGLIIPDWIIMIVVSVTLLAPSLLTFAVVQYADYPMAVFICFSSYYFFTMFYTTKKGFENQNERLETDFDDNTSGGEAGKSSILLGVSVFFPALIKDEGMIVAGIQFLFLAVYFISRRDLKRIVGLISGVLIVAMPLLFWKLNVPALTQMKAGPADIIGFVFSLDRYKLPVFFLMVFHLKEYFLTIPILALYLLFTYPRRSIFLLPIVLCFIVYWGVFVITSYDQLWHLSTAFGRISSQLVPAFMLTVAILCGNKMELHGKQGVGF